jgi:hypothetical protein
MRKIKLAKSKEDAIQLARELIQDYGEDRRWLITAPPDSYAREQYHCEVQVLEGSPPRGYVLVASRHAGGTVIAFDSLLRELKRFDWSGK